MGDKRKDIQVNTFKSIEEFLKKQTGPVFKSNIVKKINVNYDSLNLALEMLETKTDEEGRVELDG